MRLSSLCSHYVVTLMALTIFIISLNAADSSWFFKPVISQTNETSINSNNANQTEPESTVTSNTTTEFENSTIILTATRIGTEGNNYIWTSEARNSPTLNLRPNTEYEFIINTMPEDENEHELKISTIQGEEIAEGDSVDEGESTRFVFNSGQPRMLSYFCEYHPTSMIGPINVTE
jgi:plastocyanin